MRIIDEYEVGLKEKPVDTRHIIKRPVGLIAPPFIISLLTTENLLKCKLDQVEKSVLILLKIIHLASRKSYLIISIPNSYETLTKNKIM